MISHDLAKLSAKITATHLERLACVYVRQSTPKQVKRHQESQRYQYHLVQRAATLGWSKERTRVIDSDLGLSGSESSHRGGFTDLVAEVSGPCRDRPWLRSLAPRPQQPRLVSPA
jgi:hypothetical protein